MLDEIYNDSSERMDKSVEALNVVFSKIRAGRAHPSLLDQIVVEYYDSQVPIAQVANIVAEDARTLKISPWEKEMVAVIEKAIMTSELGLNPSSVGDVIRVPLPPLTEERRKELIKVVRDEAEHSKVAIRNIRREANSDIKDLQNGKKISEDEARAGESNIQNMTDSHIKIIDAKLADKEKSLLEI